MLANINTDTAFNSFKYIDEIPYKIFEFLAKSKAVEAENLWKCLKYNEVDCLSRPNLTYEEKLDLIWTGQTQTRKYRVFNVPMVTDSLDESEEMTQLRLYEKQSIPTSALDAIISFEFDIFTNDKTSSIYNDRGVFVEKTAFIVDSCLLPLLNGVDLGIGYNYLRYDREQTRENKSMIGLSNSKAWYGRYIIMSLSQSQIDIGGICG